MPTHARLVIIGAGMGAEPIMANGQAVGYVTSANYGYLPPSERSYTSNTSASASPPPWLPTRSGMQGWRG